MQKACFVIDIGIKRLPKASKAVSRNQDSGAVCINDDRAVIKMPRGSTKLHQIPGLYLGGSRMFSLIPTPRHGFFR